MNKKQVLHGVLVVAIVAAILLAAHFLNLGPALAQALIALHGRR